MRWQALLLPLCLPAIAHGNPSVSGKISLTGFYYVEQELLPAGADRTTLAMPAKLAFGDARLLLTGRGLIKDHFDFRIDARVRATGNFDYERKFDPQALSDSPQVVSARGYLGGPEYDLREVNATLRFGERGGLQLGRMYVVEADLLKIDGLRVNIAPSTNWTLSLFGGGMPNPYSRSLLSDYQPPCGSGVAAGDTTLNLKAPLAGTPSSLSAAIGACQTAGAQFAFAGGLAAAYRYERLWGNVGLVGTFLSGEGDGGAVVVDPARNNTVSNLAAPSTERDAPRIFLSWNNHLRPLDKLDLFANLVVDFFGSAGPQLTRALLTGTLRLLRDDRLTLRATYSHMSALAISMYLNRQLYNRVSNGTTLAGLGVVENNLTVLRTGRDEVRLNADLKIVRKLLGYLEGRFRYRTLINGDSNPAVYQSNLYTDNTANFAGDFTIGFRDGGSLAGITAILNYMYMDGFRARNHILHGGLGRGFLKDRLNFDLDYTAVIVTDSGAGGSTCNANQFPSFNSGLYQQNPAVSVFLADCYGRRNGTTHELGATLGANPWRRLYFLADYRFIALLTNPQDGIEVPTVLAHSVLFRAEYGF